MLTDSELDAMVQAVFEYHGYDFSGYSRASLKRRMERLFELDRFASFAQFMSQVRTDAEYARHMVEELTVNVTEMFRDPGFYQTLRREILPQLATKPFIRIWHAGCSTGEEVYSMAILLDEAGLLAKSVLYATDLSPVVLQAARSGIFPLKAMKQYSENYLQSGGVRDFSGYYTAQYTSAKFDEKLSRKMVYAAHNLVSDNSFNEFDLILCRNVMIYFDKPLQERVLSLFDQSLSPLGFLALGSKETINHSSLRKSYTQWNNQRIWQKKI
jgi:chemotaxis protein methyltransferase CheR